MWNVNEEHIQRMKEKLRGRRAASRARYESEVRAVEDDLNEIEELERIAYAFVARHRPTERDAPVELTPEPMPVLQSGFKGESLVDVAANQISGRDEVTPETEPETELESEDAAEPSALELMKRPMDSKRLSLWRGRRTSDVGS